MAHGAVGRVGPVGHVGRYALPMQRSAMRLLEIPLARHTLKLSPWLAPRMPVGADSAPAHPAVVEAVVIGTELVPCIDCASASPCQGNEGGRRTRGLRAGYHGVCTGGTQGFVDEAGEGCGLLGALFDGRGGRARDRARRGSTPEPPPPPSPPPKPPPLQPPMPPPAPSAPDAPFSTSARASLQPCGLGMPGKPGPPADGPPGLGPPIGP